MRSGWRHPRRRRPDQSSGIVGVTARRTLLITPTPAATLPTRFAEVGPTAAVPAGRPLHPTFAVAITLLSAAVALTIAIEAAALAFLPLAVPASFTPTEAFAAWTAA